MNERQRAALERATEQAQECSRRNWNRLVEQDEQELRVAETEAQQRRDQFRVIDGERAS